MLLVKLPNRLRECTGGINPVKLIEIAQPVDLGKIKQILDRHGIEGYTINPDGTVDVNGNVNFSNHNIPSIPVQFGHVTGSFECSNTPITSLAGCPHTVGDKFYCYSTEIISLAGSPHTVGARFDCSSTRIKSLSGVHKIVKHIGETIYIPTPATHLLGLLLIEGLQKIVVGVDRVLLSNILTKHLKDRDVLLAQDELLDAGFVEQAKL